jgi:hypothetical protein
MSEEKGEVNPNFPKEWETARSILSTFDDKLYDVRKYGFGLITTLIAAEGIILTGVTTTHWPDDVKFTVLLVNILLIAALTIIERNFLVIQKAAATRARVLERTMNLELSEIITQRFHAAGLEIFATGLYTFFVLIVILLGWVTIETLYLQLAITAAGIFAIAAILLIRNYITIDYPHGELDWTIDRLRCTQGDEVGITLTNLAENPLIFKVTPGKPKVMWLIREEKEQTTASDEEKKELEETRTQTPSAGQGIITKTLELPPDDSYTWLWSNKICCGVYRIYRRTQKDGVEKLVLLQRKILISKKPKETPAEPIKVALIKPPP